MRLGPLTLCLLPLACATPGEARGPARQTAEMIVRHGQEGQATFYGESFRGTTTASGERFDPEALTAAHRTLRFGTRVEVQSLRGPERVVVRINDAQSPWYDADLDMLAAVGAAAVMVPKAEEPELLEQLFVLSLAKKSK